MIQIFEVLCDVIQLVLSDVILAGLNRVQIHSVVTD